MHAPSPAGGWHISHEGLAKEHVVKPGAMTKPAGAILMKYTSYEVPR